MSIKAEKAGQAIHLNFAYREALRGFVVLFLVIPMVNLLLVGLRGHFNLTTNTLFLLVLTVIISIKSSLWLAIVSAVENFLFLNFLFTPPFHTFVIADKNDAISLFLSYFLASLPQ